jgi:hypothetical protein
VKRTRRALSPLLFLAAALPLGAQQPEESPSESAADPGDVCTSGVITAIELNRRDPFEPDSVAFGPVSLLYRVLNTLHVRTQAGFVRNELLVDVGDCYDDFLVSESARLLDAYGFLESARIEEREDQEGNRALQVRTRDAWSTSLGVGITYDDGINLESVGVTERNFLGYGLSASFRHQEFRELRAQSFRLATPRLFGRTDASVEFGRDRPGTFFNQYLRYPFLGDTGRYSVRQAYGRGYSYFAYAAPVGDGGTQILVPTFREAVELSAAQRFGDRGQSLIVGMTLSYGLARFDAPLGVVNGDIDGAQPLPPAALPDGLAGQLNSYGSTRLSLHLGVRQFRYAEYQGLDALRERLLVGLGGYVGISAGQGFGLFTPDDVRGLDDSFVRGIASFAAPLGSSLFRAAATGEMRYDGGWRDKLASAELVGYLRGRVLPGQTIFLRSSFAGGWGATAPFQLSLGGRQSVRSLPEDAYPGGQSARFTVEDRIVLPWPTSAMDLGMTFFADAGRIWPGDAPLGVDSGWQYAVGGGIRFALPAGSRFAWRADLAFPAGGTTGDPIFRIGFEFNRLARGFTTPDLQRSLRFALGPESF